MTLQQLRYFLETCRQGSFAAAADALYLAQPSVADQVRRLEDELGTKLFVRSGRRLQMTDAGRTLRPEAEAVMATVDRAAASVLDVRELRGGTASLGTFSTAHRYLLSTVVSEFAARHPDVSVRLIGQNSLEVTELIRSGDLEAGLVVLPLDTKGFEVEPVMEDENFIASADEVNGLEAVTVEQLATLRLIVYDAHFGWRSPPRRQLAERARAAGVILEPAIEVEHCEAAVELAAKGLGSTIVSKTVRESPGFPASLKTVPLAPPLHDVLAIIWPKDSHLSPATDALLSFTRAHIRRIGGPVGTLSSSAG